MNIREVLITYDEPWPEKHMRSLQTAYGKTAYGEEVMEGLGNILNLEKEKLWDLNLLILDYLVSMFRGEWKYTLTESFELHYTKEVTDLRSGIEAGKSSLSPAWIPTYPQVQRLHKSFQPNLTILDALCHLGGGTSDYLARYAAQLYPTT